MGLSTAPDELRALTALAQQLCSYRAMGCSALDLCCLAAGQIDLFVDLSNTAKAVDVLAAALIAEEAGAVVETLEGVRLIDHLVDQPDLAEAIYRQRFRTVATAGRQLRDEVATVISTLDVSR